MDDGTKRVVARLALRGICAALMEPADFMSPAKAAAEGAIMAKTDVLQANRIIAETGLAVEGFIADEEFGEKSRDSYNLLWGLADITEADEVCDVEDHSA